MAGVSGTSCREPVNTMKIPYVRRNSLARTMPGLLEDLRRYLDENYLDLDVPLYGSFSEVCSFSAEYDAPDVELSAPLVQYSIDPMSPEEYHAKFDGHPRPKYERGHSAEPDIERILKKAEPTFSEYLADLLRERGGRYSEVYRRAEVSRQLFSKILNDRDYRPTRSTVIQLAIGLELDLAQTQKLLEKAGFILTRSSRADLIVQYFIDRGLYNVTFINEALYDCGLPLLTTGLRA